MANNPKITGRLWKQQTKLKARLAEIEGEFSMVEHLRDELAKAHARLMETEEDAELMRDLKREIKGLNTSVTTRQPHYLYSQGCAGEGVTQRLYHLWRRIQLEADMASETERRVA